MTITRNLETDNKGYFTNKIDLTFNDQSGQSQKLSNVKEYKFLGWILKVIGFASEVELENGESCYVKTSSLVRQIAKKVLQNKNIEIDKNEVDHILNLDKTLPNQSIHKIKMDSISSSSSSITVNAVVNKTISTDERSTIDEAKLVLIFKRFFDFPAIMKF